MTTEETRVPKDFFDESESESCPECGALDPDHDTEAKYECPECGNEFRKSESYTGDNHQCPDCRKFSSRIEDAELCGECGEESEFETVHVFTCTECQEKLIDPSDDDLIEHLSEHGIEFK